MDESRQCGAITASGKRCSARAQEGSEWCWNHRPDRAEERRTNASAGGRARSRRPPGELAKIKTEIKNVIAAVLNGQVDRGSGAIVLQGFNTLLRAIETERKLDRFIELEETVEELRDRLEEVKRSRWGA
jgi:hypothetical protein